MRVPRDRGLAVGFGVLCLLLGVAKLMPMSPPPQTWLPRAWMIGIGIFEVIGGLLLIGRRSLLPVYGMLMISVAGVIAPWVATLSGSCGCLGPLVIAREVQIILACIVGIWSLVLIRDSLKPSVAKT